MTPQQHVEEAERIVRDVIEHGAPAHVLDDARTHVGLAELAARAPEVTR